MLRDFHFIARFTDRISPTLLHTCRNPRIRVSRKFPFHLGDSNSGFIEDAGFSGRNQWTGRCGDLSRLYVYGYD